MAQEEENWEDWAPSEEPKPTAPTQEEQPPKPKVTRPVLCDVVTKEDTEQLLSKIPKEFVKTIQKSPVPATVAQPPSRALSPKPKGKIVKAASARPTPTTKTTTKHPVSEPLKSKSKVATSSGTPIKHPAVSEPLKSKYKASTSPRPATTPTPTKVVVKAKPQKLPVPKTPEPSPRPKRNSAKVNVKAAGAGPEPTLTKDPVPSPPLQSKRHIQVKVSSPPKGPPRRKMMDAVVLGSMSHMTISEKMDTDEAEVPEVNGNINIPLMSPPPAPANHFDILNGNANGTNGATTSTADANTSFELPIVPQVTCAGGLTPCKEIGMSAFPCRRCHREFYCSTEHQQENAERHQTDCKTVSKLEVINQDEEYSTWLKYAAPHLYDTCLNFVLVWPSLTVQWYPEFTELEKKVRHKILLGTHAGGGEQNHLLICGVDIADRPEPDPRIPEGHWMRIPTKHAGELVVLKRISHEGEINRARYMPQRNNIVATKSPSSEVFIFDTNEHPEVAVDDVFRPSLRLAGHNKEGFGLDWHPTLAGKLLSGSSDGLICLWDINTAPTEGVIQAFSTYIHGAYVEDVGWSQDVPHVFASVGDDRRLVIWDTRNTPNYNASSCVADAHQDDINSVSFSPFSEFVLATGSADKSVCIWDMRNLAKKLFTLDSHRDSVLKVQWSPHGCSILATAGQDRRVFTWNLKNTDGPETKVENVEYEYEDGDDDEVRELTFIHGGHVATVNDFSWNLHEIGMIASVSDDNILQVWQMADHLERLKNSDSDEEDSDSEMSEEEP